ncbi:MAG: hypothetical protein H7145_24040 [Akkermansiaceae bacterium]|nr:hypothetical protein [Armatimonadota bacterium]
MKYTPILAVFAVIAGLATAYHVDARVPEPRYNLDFAFGTDSSIRVEVGATDTFHVVTRRGREVYEVSGTTVPERDNIVARIATGKAVSETVKGPNKAVGDATRRSSVNSVILLVPGGEPVAVGGSRGEPFSVALSPVETKK